MFNQPSDTVAATSTLNSFFDSDAFFSIAGMVSPETHSSDANTEDHRAHSASSALRTPLNMSVLDVRSRNTDYLRDLLKHYTRNEARNAPPASTHQECNTTALNALELSMVWHACDTKCALPDEFLRFLAAAKSGIRTLASLANCDICTRSSPFVVLVVVVMDKYLDAMDRAIKLLSSHGISAETSRLSEYGVDTVANFVSMYSPLVLPAIAALKTIINKLRQECHVHALGPPMKSLELAGRRLSSLDTDVVSLL